MNSEMKVAFVGSSGGHLNHLLKVKKAFDEYESFWVTFDKIDANSALAGEKVYHAFFPTNRNLTNLVKNFWLAIKVLVAEKPDVIISSGAAVAVPFFYVGKILGAKLIYVEVIDRIDSPTLTGKLVYPITNLFLVQWETMLQVYPKAMYIGRLY